MSSGQEAFNELVENSQADKKLYDVVFMDWEMPGLSGIDASALIREYPDFKNNPRIIMVSAYDQEEVMKNGNNLNLNGFLNKPVTPSMLLNSVMEALRSDILDKKSDSMNVYQGAPHTGLNLEGVRVLLAEDNEISQQVVIEFLEYEGCIVVLAENGREALKILTEAKDDYFDLVLMDLQMPLMGGYEAVREIRKIERYNKIPIIAMTADARKGVEKDIISGGMNDYVAKPIDPNELLKRLIQWGGVKKNKTGKPGKGHFKFKPSGTIFNNMKLEGLDLEKGLMRVVGKEDLYLRLLIKFKNKYKSIEKDIYKNLSEGNSEEVSRLVHMIKGVAGNIGAVNLSEISERILLQLNEEDTGSLKILADTFVSELKRVVKTIEGLDAGKDAVTAETSMSREIDEEKVFKIIQNITELINNDLGAALDELEELEVHVKGSTLWDLYSQLEICMTEFDTEKAYILLKKMADGITVSREE